MTTSSNNHVARARRDEPEANELVVMFWSMVGDDHVPVSEAIFFLEMCEGNLDKAAAMYREQHPTSQPGAHSCSDSFQMTHDDNHNHHHHHHGSSSSSSFQNSVNSLQPGDLLHGSTSSLPNPPRRRRSTVSHYNSASQLPPSHYHSYNEPGLVQRTRTTTCREPSTFHVPFSPSANNHSSGTTMEGSRPPGISDEDYAAMIRAMRGADEPAAAEPLQRSITDPTNSRSSGSHNRAMEPSLLAAASINAVPLAAVLQSFVDPRTRVHSSSSVPTTPRTSLEPAQMARTSRTVRMNTTTPPRSPINASNQPQEEQNDVPPQSINPKPHEEEQVQESLSDFEQYFSSPSRNSNDKPPMSHSVTSTDGSFSVPPSLVASITSSSTTTTTAYDSSILTTDSTDFIADYHQSQQQPTRVSLRSSTGSTACPVVVEEEPSTLPLPLQIGGATMLSTTTSDANNNVGDTSLKKPLPLTTNRKPPTATNEKELTILKSPPPSSLQPLPLLQPSPLQHNKKPTIAERSATLALVDTARNVSPRRIRSDPQDYVVKGQRRTTPASTPGVVRVANDVPSTNVESQKLKDPPAPVSSEHTVSTPQTMAACTTSEKGVHVSSNKGEEHDNAKVPPPSAAKPEDASTIEKGARRKAAVHPGVVRVTSGGDEKHDVSKNSPQQPADNLSKGARHTRAVHPGAVSVSEKREPSATSPSTQKAVHRNKTNVQAEPLSSPSSVRRTKTDPNAPVLSPSTKKGGRRVKATVPGAVSVSAQDETEESQPAACETSAASKNEELPKPANHDIKQVGRRVAAVQPGAVAVASTGEVQEPEIAPPTKPPASSASIDAKLTNVTQITKKGRRGKKATKPGAVSVSKTPKAEDEADAPGSMEGTTQLEKDNHNTNGSDRVEAPSVDPTGESLDAVGAESMSSIGAAEPSSSLSTISPARALPRSSAGTINLHYEISNKALTDETNDVDAPAENPTSSVIDINLPERGSERPPPAIPHLSHTGDKPKKETKDKKVSPIVKASQPGVVQVDASGKTKTKSDLADKKVKGKGKRKPAQVPGAVSVVAIPSPEAEVPVSPVADETSGQQRPRRGSALGVVLRGLGRGRGGRGDNKGGK